MARQRGNLALADGPEGQDIFCSYVSCERDGAWNEAEKIPQAYATSADPLNLSALVLFAALGKPLGGNVDASGGLAYALLGIANL